MFKYFGIDSEFLDKENIISKLNLLLKLERSDPYHTNYTLQERIQNSLECIPREHRKYALALFANVLYFPSSFSNCVLEHMLNLLSFEFDIKREELGSKCLILEQDPTGIINTFLRTNHIEGRLDKNKFQRTQQVKTFVTTSVINHSQPQLSEMTGEECSDPLDRLRIENVLPFLERNYWIVLIDNALSGTSLFSDIDLLLRLSRRCGKKPQKIILLIRTLTKQAEEIIKEKFNDEINSGLLIFRYGLLLDNRFVIRRGNNECILFKNPDTYEGVVELCEWLSRQKFFKSDSRISDHSKNSGDNSKVKGFDPTGSLTFGFKGCGLTYVTSENCPSDSLPLLWFDKPGKYTSPFPRVLSRLGDREAKSNSDIQTLN
jgi:hypothetical protein